MDYLSLHCLEMYLWPNIPKSKQSQMFPLPTRFGNNRQQIINNNMRYVLYKSTVSIIFLCCAE